MIVFIMMVMVMVTVMMFLISTTTFVDMLMVIIMLIGQHPYHTAGPNRSLPNDVPLAVATSFPALSSCLAEAAGRPRSEHPRAFISPIGPSASETVVACV